jgi:hypothetical protein
VWWWPPTQGIPRKDKRHIYTVSSSSPLYPTADNIEREDAAFIPGSCVVFRRSPDILGCSSKRERPSQQNNYLIIIIIITITTTVNIKKIKSQITETK